MIDIVGLTVIGTNTSVWCQTSQIAQVFTDPANDQTYVLCGGSGLYVNETVKEVLCAMFSDVEDFEQELTDFMAAVEKHRSEK